MTRRDDLTRARIQIQATRTFRTRSCRDCAGLGALGRQESPRSTPQTSPRGRRSSHARRVLDVRMSGGLRVSAAVPKTVSRAPRDRRQGHGVDLLEPGGVRARMVPRAGGPDGAACRLRDRPATADRYHAEGMRSWPPTRRASRRRWSGSPQGASARQSPTPRRRQLRRRRGPGRQQLHADSQPFQRAACSASICKLLPTPALDRLSRDRPRTNKQLDDGTSQDIERAIGRPSDQRVVVIRKPDAGRGAPILARR
jgi:hypothetical protein